MNELRAESVEQDRLLIILLGTFAGVALVLAALGTYGVVAFTVHQRTPEIGIRLAVGAQRHHILRLVLGQGARLAAIGLALGLAVPLGAYFALVPIILLIVLMPITINGIGTTQAGFVWLFGRAGVGSAAAFALSVLFLGIAIVGNLPGAVLYLTGSGRVADRRGP